MPNLFAKYETDPERERTGVEINIDGSIFVVRRAGGRNRRYHYAVQRIARERYATVFDDLSDSDKRAHAEDLEDHLTQEAFAETVILGWRGVEDRNGAPLTFSREAFLDLMRACPDVWEQLRAAAIDINRFRINGHALGKP